VLIVGAHPWAREIAQAISDTGTEVLMVDTNWKHISDAKLDGLDAVYASVLSEQIMDDDIDLSQMGRLLALTRNDEVNSLASLRFAEVFGRASVFQLPLPEGDRGRKGINLEQHGRCLFSPGITHDYLAGRFNQGSLIKTVKLTKEFDYGDFRSLYGPTALPMFLIDEAGQLVILSTDSSLRPRAGQTVISLVDSQDETVATIAQTQQAQNVQAVDPV
jgi:hypothetical protein